MKSKIIRKLDPRRVRYPARLAALAGYVLNKRWTQPRIVGLQTTTDGFVLAAHDDDPLYNATMGSLAALRSAWQRVCKLAKLDAAETAAADKLFASRVG